MSKSVPSSEGEPSLRADSAIEQITMLEEERCQSLMKRDWQTLDRLLAEDLIHVHSTGKVEDKATYLKSAAEDFEFLRVVRPSFTVRIYQDSLAISMGTLEQELYIRPVDRVVAMKAFVTQVWQRRKKGWFQLSFQSTPIN